jgi:hypothetical protein
LPKRGETSGSSFYWKLEACLSSESLNTTSVTTAINMLGLIYQDSSPDGEQFMPGQRQRITLTSDGLAWLAKHRPQLVPEISRESILDKSKSDWLAKAFTCWQASYFCIQCVYRLSQRL